MGVCVCVCMYIVYMYIHNIFDYLFMCDGLEILIIINIIIFIYLHGISLRLFDSGSFIAHRMLPIQPLRYDNSNNCTCSDIRVYSRLVSK